MPVRPTRGLGESRWYRENGRPYLREGPIELRKPHVIADGQAEFGPRQVGHDGFAAACNRVRFPVSFSRGQIDIEEMDLAVARSNPTAWVKKKRPICSHLWSGFDRERSH